MNLYVLAILCGLDVEAMYLTKAIKPMVGCELSRFGLDRPLSWPSTIECPGCICWDSSAKFQFDCIVGFELRLELIEFS